MRRRLLLLVALLMPLVVVGGTALADGPSGSAECHLADDDCDGRVDEDSADGADNDGDGRVDEDPAGNTADHPAKNQAQCNAETSQDLAGLAFAFAGAEGVEVCGDDRSQVPVGGRLIVTTADGGYAAIDGDNSNSEPANGYARVDQGGIHCGNDANQDSTADQTNNAAADCG